MIYKSTIFLSLIFSAIFFLILYYFFNIILHTCILIFIIAFILINIALIIFFKSFSNAFKKLYIEIKLGKVDELSNINFGDQLLNQLFKTFGEKLIEMDNMSKNIASLKDGLLDKDEAARKLKVKIKDKTIDIEEDYSEMIDTFDKIENVYEDLNLNYNKEELKGDNLLNFLFLYQPFL